MNNHNSDELTNIIIESYETTSNLEKTVKDEMFYKNLIVKREITTGIQIISY